MLSAPPPKSETNLALEYSGSDLESDSDIPILITELQILAIGYNSIGQNHPNSKCTSLTLTLICVCCPFDMGK